MPTLGNIRIAELKDIDRVVDICEDYYKDLKYDKHLPFDRDFVREQILFFYFSDQTKDKSVIIYYEDETGRIVAFAGVVLTPSMHSRNWNAVVNLLYAKDSSSYKGLKLLRLCEEWARYKGAKSFRVSKTNLSPDKIESLFKRLGLYEKEVVYYKELDT